MGENWQVIVNIFEEYSLIIAVFIIIALIYGSFKWYKTKIKAD
ncbi:alkaline phosphatase [Lactobacillus amylovorus CAG:719]|nr:alkaline phosphatase [Lactobacillus amylovorus CAG:719]